MIRSPLYVIYTCITHFHDDDDDDDDDDDAKARLG